MHPAFRGLMDYGALKTRSNDTYDQEANDLRAAPDYGSFNNAMSLRANQANSISPWAPFFEATGDAKFAQDAGRPHGLYDSPSFAENADIGVSNDLGIPHQALMKSNNLAGAQPVDQRSLAINGLLGALPKPRG